MQPLTADEKDGRNPSDCSAASRTIPVRVRRLATLAIMGASLCLLLFVSWTRWGDFVVDTFRDPWVFHRLAGGEVLYRDMFYPYGFLAPYSVSILYRIFGTHLLCSVGVGIVLTMLSGMFLYRIGRFFLNRVFSTLLVLNFLFVFAFGSYHYNDNFNFILPYSISATFLISFVLAALYFFLKFLLKREPRNLLFWGVSIFLAFLTRFDVTAPVWMAFTMIGLLDAALRRRAGFLIWFLLPPVAGFLSYAALLAGTGAFHGFRESIFGVFSYYSHGQYRFDRFHSGLVDPGGNALAVLGSFAALAISVAGMYAAAVGIGFLWPAGKVFAVFAVSMAAVAGMAMALLVWRLLPSLDQYRMMPILLLAGMVYAAVLLRSEADKDRWRPLSLLALFAISLVLCMRIVLKASPAHYGFTLLLPGLAATYVFLFDLLPTFMGRAVRIGTRSRAFFCVSLCFFLALTALPFVRYNWASYRAKTASFSFPRGTKASFGDDITRCFFEATFHMLSRTPAGSTLVAFPEGVGINFFSNRDNPTRYDTFMPSNIGAAGEDRIIEEMEAHRPDYVAILTRGNPDYGESAFGIDYGRGIVAWIEKNYAGEARFGPYPPSRDFAILLMRRK